MIWSRTCKLTSGQFHLKKLTSSAGPNHRKSFPNQPRPVFLALVTRTKNLHLIWSLLVTSFRQEFSHRKSFSKFQIYRIRTTHESLSPTMNCVRGIVLNTRRNSPVPELLEMVSSFTPLYFSFWSLCSLDAPVANAPTPTSDSRSLLPPPLVTNDVKSPPVPNNASKRSNARKNQYGDEVYEWTSPSSSLVKNTFWIKK